MTVYPVTWPIIINNIECVKWDDVASVLGVTVSAIYDYLKKGHTNEEMIEYYLNKPNTFIKWSAVVNGIEYHTKAEIAKSLGAPTSSLYRLLKNSGGDVQKMVDTYVGYQKNKRKPQYLGGIEYSSVAATAAKIGISRSTYDSYRNLGLSPDDILAKFKNVSRKKTYMINGKVYSTKEVADLLGVQVSTIRNRLNRGCSAQEIFDDITKNGCQMTAKIPFVIDGVKYKSVRSAAKELGVDAPMIIRKLKKGFSNEEIVNHYRQLNKPIKYEYKIDGVVYRCRREFANQLGAGISAINHLLDKGLTLDEIVQHYKKDNSKESSIRINKMLKNKVVNTKFAYIGRDSRAYYRMICRECGNEIIMTHQEAMMLRDSDSFCKDHSI